ncbi:MAG: NAD-dependent epimerase/dehydratase family protein [Prosthecobacter sp.]|jgi:dTDP-6-deoxy-L-talose 4-dehydrogenase (NAD+)
MRIFVTGATGFIGRAFCQQAVARGHQLLALVRNPAALDIPGVEIAAGNLLETPWDKVVRFAPDAALHLAWTAEPGVYLNSPENEVWLEQSKAWFQRLFDLGVPYVAGTGTCIEYAPSEKPLIEEVSPLSPQFPYSKAKVELFEWLRACSPKTSAWFRIFFPYGAGEHPKRLTSLAVKRLREGLPLLLNAPDSIRDYIEVGDAASAMLRVVEGKLTGPYNVGTGGGITLAELGRRIARVLGVDEGLVRAAEGVPPDGMPVIVACAERLRKTGWLPRVTLDEGVGKLVEACYDASQ